MGQSQRKGPRQWLLGCYDVLDLIVLIILGYIRALCVDFEAVFDVDIDGVDMGGWNSPLDENLSKWTSWSKMEVTVVLLTP